MTVIDLSSDRGFVKFGHLKANLPELPDFVKESEIPQLLDTAELPRESFADQFDRKFPIHTKAAAFISYLYYKNQAGQFSKAASARIENKFQEAATFWGIRTELGFVDNTYAPVQEKKAGAESYALSAGGSFFFPIDTPTNTVRSANELIQCRGNFTYSMRKEAATNIMRAAVQHGMRTLDIPEELHRMAGFGLCEKSAAVSEVERRVLYAKGSKSSMVEPMKKLASDLRAAETLDPETMVKVSEIIDMTDRVLGIVRGYGTTFSFPEDVFFGAFTEKTAAHIKRSTVSMITGKQYTFDQLSKASEALKVFGDDFHKDVVMGDGSVDLDKVADVLPTMPRDEAALFDRAMSSVLMDKGV